ncbi:MAG TPA: DoxX family protein [Bryobacteraceae bacterium]|nr:DoxX family protein [Bryobacteraceae bacterium]
MTIPFGLQPAAASRAKTRTGHLLSGLAIAFLLFDCVIKFINPPFVAQASVQIGWSPALAPDLGMILLACTVLYAVPRTSVLGAILLTGYLGGAVATHLRVGDPLLSHVLFPVYLGVILWTGLWLREDRLRVLLPGRS